MATAGRDSAGRPSASRTGTLWVGVLVGLLVLGLLGLLWVWAAQPGDIRFGAPPPPANATIGEIANQPTAFVGEQVTVAGDINNIFSPSAFTINSNGIVPGNDVLVVSREPLAPVPGGPAERAARWGDLALVTGEVRIFDLAAFQEEAPEVLFDPDWAQAFVGRPAILAAEVDLTPRLAPGMQGPVVTAASLAEGFNQYTGQVVTVSGDMTDFVSPHAIVFDGQVLVVGSNEVIPVPDAPTAQREGFPPIKTGTAAQASGVVLPFDREAISRELGIELQEGLFSNWEGKPVVIARAFEVVR